MIQCKWSHDTQDLAYPLSAQVTSSSPKSSNMTEYLSLSFICVAVLTNTMMDLSYNTYSCRSQNPLWCSLASLRSKSSSIITCLHVSSKPPLSIPTLPLTGGPRYHRNSHVSLQALMISCRASKISDNIPTIPQIPLPPCLTQHSPPHSLYPP